MKLITNLMVSVAALTLVACSGGSGDSGYSHSQLAKDFVEGLNIEYDTTSQSQDEFFLVKTNTRQWDYIVVYDEFNFEYNAYDLSDYVFGEDVGGYLDYGNGDHFYDLVDLGGNVYEDYYTGYQFSKTQMTTSDTVKAREIVNGIKIKKATDKLTVQFGLSPKRAKEVAVIAMQINQADKATMTTYKYDQYSKAVLGSTFSEVQGALQDKLSGNNTSLDNVYSKAAKANGISKASVKQLADLFIKN